MTAIGDLLNSIIASPASTSRDHSRNTSAREDVQHDMDPQEREQIQKIRQLIGQCNDLEEENQHLSKTKLRYYGQRAQLRKYVEKLEKELANKDEENTVLVTGMREVQARADEDAQKIRRIEGEKKILTARTQDMERRAKDAETSSQKAQAQILTMKSEASRQTQEHETTLAELANTKKKLDDLSSLLDVRTAELKGAQSFLSTADAVTGTHIIDSLRRFNNEVMQAAAYLAEEVLEYLKFDEVAEQVVSEDRRIAVQTAGNVMGPKLAEYLLMKSHKNEPLLLQIAFQSFLAVEFYWVMNSWIAGEKRVNNFLDTVYRRVRETEAQAVFGKWRAITHANLLPPDDARGVEAIVDMVANGLCHILLVAKCATPMVDIQGILRAKVAHRVEIMAKMALEIGKNIAQDVTSCNYQVVARQSGCVFVLEEMDDAYDDSQSRRQTNSQLVLCPTDLGLLQHTKVGSGKDGRWNTRMLLKPKVALESVVEVVE